MNLNKLLVLLANKKIFLVIFFLAIAARIALQLYFFSIWDDRSFQLVAAKSFVEGHGFSIPHVVPQNLHRQIYSPLIGWPPGYSIFLSVLYFVCNKNVILAAIVLEIVTSILFLFFLHRLLKLLDLSRWLITVYVLISGFFIYDFAAASTSDFQALVFFLIGMYCVLLFIKSEKQPAFGILIGMSLFLSPVTRYMYYLVALMPSLYLIWTGYIQKDRRLFKGGLYCTSTLIFLFTGLIVYQLFFTGSVFYTSVPQKGIYPLNVLRINPVMFTSFIDVQVLCSLLQSMFGLDFVKQLDIIRYIHLLPFACALVYAMFYLIKALKKNKTLTQHYLNLGILSSLNIIFLLLFLSLTHAPEHSLGYAWTYVQEPRYYAFVTIFFQQLIIILLFLRKKKNWIAKTFSIVCAMLIGIQVLHGFYFVTTKLATEHNDFRFQKNRAAVQNFLYESLGELRQHHRNQKIIAVSDDFTIQNLAVLRGYTVVYDARFLNNQMSLQSHDIVFLVVLRDVARQGQHGFLEHKGIKLRGIIKGYYFYTLES